MRFIFIVVTTVAAIGSAALYPLSFRSSAYPRSSESPDMCDATYLFWGYVQDGSISSGRVQGLRGRIGLWDGRRILGRSRDGQLAFAIAIPSTVPGGQFRIPTPPNGFHAGRSQFELRGSAGCGFGYPAPGTQEWECFRRFGNTSKADLYYVQFPIWSAAGSFLLFPIFALVRGPCRRWCRRHCGLCLKCGNNLTGLPEPRCPECGREFWIARGA